MKIAFILQPWNVIRSSDGGSNSLGILTVELARKLARKNSVVIYARRGKKHPKFASDKFGIQYRRFSSSIIRAFLTPLRLLDRVNPKKPLFASTVYYFDFIFKVAIDLRKQKPDVVHIHNFSQFVPIVRAIVPRAKIVLHMHCEWLTQLDRRVIERRLRKTDLILSPSDYITQKTAKKFPQFRARCRTLPNGMSRIFTDVQKSSVSLQTKPKTILYVGRVSPEKGMHVLMDAFKKVATKFPEVTLDIVGPAGLVTFEFLVGLSDDSEVLKLRSFYGRGKSRATYLSYLKSQLGADSLPKVNFHGHVSHGRLTEFYENADVFVFPSVWHEPFGMPIVEAMASGVPVVSTQSGGITEIVQHGKSGLLVRRGNSDDLFEAILSLLRDDKQRREMGNNARTRAASIFPWQKIQDSLFGYYQGLYEGDKAGASSASITLQSP